MPVLNELKKQFLTEFDYRGEARNLEEVARNVLPVWGGCVAMPEPVPELVSEHVLTMSFLPGEKLELALKREWAGALGGAQGADLVDAVVAGGVGGGALGARVVLEKNMMLAQQIDCISKTFNLGAVSRCSGQIVARKSMGRKASERLSESLRGFQRWLARSLTLSAGIKCAQPISGFQLAISESLSEALRSSQRLLVVRFFCLGHYVESFRFAPKTHLRFCL